MSVTCRPRRFVGDLHMNRLLLSEFINLGMKILEESRKCIGVEAVASFLLFKVALCDAGVFCLYPHASLRILLRGTINVSFRHSPLVSA